MLALFLLKKRSGEAWDFSPGGIKKVYLNFKKALITCHWNTASVSSVIHKEPKVFRGNAYIWLKVSFNCVVSEQEIRINLLWLHIAFLTPFQMESKRENSKPCCNIFRICFCFILISHWTQHVFRKFFLSPEIWMMKLTTIIMIFWHIIDVSSTPILMLQDCTILKPVSD